MKMVHQKTKTNSLGGLVGCASSQCTFYTFYAYFTWKSPEVRWSRNKAQSKNQEVSGTKLNW